MFDWKLKLFEWETGIYFYSAGDNVIETIGILYLVLAFSRMGDSYTWISFVEFDDLIPLNNSVGFFGELVVYFLIQLGLTDL